MTNERGEYAIRFIREYRRTLPGTEMFMGLGVADVLVNVRRPPMAEFVDPQDNPRFQRQKAMGLGPLVQAVMGKRKRA